LPADLAARGDLAVQADGADAPGRLTGRVQIRRLARPGPAWLADASVRSARDVRTSCRGRAV
jgi:hypothetical protein